MKKANAVRWRDSDVFKLLSILESYVLDRKFDGTVRDKEAYQKLQEELEDFGIQRTVAQIRNKVKILKRMYRETKERLIRGEEDDSNKNPYFDAVDRIYGHRYIVNLPISGDNGINVNEGKYRKDF